LNGVIEWVKSKLRTRRKAAAKCAMEFDEIWGNAGKVLRWIIWSCAEIDWKSEALVENRCELEVEIMIGAKIERLESGLREVLGVNRLD
jgi:hypothetical protein